MRVRRPLQTTPLSRTCPPHVWRCPVIMKRDPDHVAWTCSGCGAIARAPIGGGPPSRLDPWQRSDRAGFNW